MNNLSCKSLASCKYKENYHVLKKMDPKIEVAVGGRVGGVWEKEPDVLAIWQNLTDQALWVEVKCSMITVSK